MSPRPRRGEIWTVRAGEESGAMRVLVVDDGVDEFLDLWFRVLPLDDDAAAATAYQPVLRAEDVHLSGAGLNDWRLVNDVPVHARREHLQVRIGSLTGRGRTLLAQLELGELPRDRFGAMPAGSIEPRLAAQLAPLLAARATAVRVLEAVLATADPGLDPDADDRYRLLERPAIDGTWTRRFQIAPGLVAVVDLLAGDRTPGIIVDTHVPGLEALAGALDDPRIHALLRALVVAETRVSARPHGLWVVDAARAAVELWRTVERLPDGALATTLEAFAVYRARQALTRVASLPHGVLLSAPRFGPAADAGPLRFLTYVGEALATLADGADGWEDAREAFRTWFAAAPAAVDEIASRRVRTQLRDVVDLLAHLGPEERAPASGPVFATIDTALFGTELLSASHAKLEVGPVVGDPGTVEVTLALLPSAARRALADPSDAAPFRNVWVEVVATDLGEVIAAALLRPDLYAGTLVATFDLPVEATHRAYGLRATGQPSRLLDVENELSEALASAPEYRAATAQQLRSLARGLANEGEGALDGGPLERVRALTYAAAARLAAASRALGPDGGDGAGLPSGAFGTLAESLIDASSRERLVLRDEAAEYDDGPSEDLDTLDDLLG